MRIVCACLFLCLTTPVFAQQQDEPEIKREESQRIAGVMPAFEVTNSKHPTPLTARQKFHLAVREAFDPFQFVAAGMQASISQAQNGSAGYGQGAEGFAKRYGAAFTDQVDSTLFTDFVLPSALKQDPRYFRDGQGPASHRLGRSIEQVFVAHNENGSRGFNWSKVLGALATGGISNLYSPENDRGLQPTLSRAGISLAWGAIGNVLGEFWPDINRKLFHKQGPQQAAGR